MSGLSIDLLTQVSNAVYNETPGFTTDADGRNVPTGLREKPVVVRDANGVESVIERLVWDESFQRVVMEIAAP